MHHDHYMIDSVEMIKSASWMEAADLFADDVAVLRHHVDSEIRSEDALDQCQYPLPTRDM